jgi:hypothetical protein
MLLPEELSFLKYLKVSTCPNLNLHCFFVAEFHHHLNCPWHSAATGSKGALK